MTFQEICHAIYSGDVESLRALKGRDGEEFVGLRTEMEGWNHLHMALIPPKDHAPIRVVEYLLQIGVDPNAKDCSGYTPLIFAARGKYVEAMRLLLDHGALINVANDNGVTPLRQSMLSKPFSVAATELLLSRGANPEAKTSNGKTDREFARLISHGDGKAIGDLFDKYPALTVSGRGPV
jgi:ankyrin repeat protein